MIDNEFVPYKEALGLKELGFDKPCFGIYLIKEFRYSSPPMLIEDITDGIEVLAPTFSQAFRWFEENHQIFVERVITTNVNEIMHIDYRIKSWRFIPKDVIFENPYDCFDKNKAELICLKKLIEIANNL